MKVLNPTSGFPTCGSSNGRRNPQKIWFWSSSGFDHRNSTGLGEIETPLLEGAHRISSIQRSSGKSSDLIRDWAQRTCQYWRVSGRGRGQLWFTVGKRTEEAPGWALLEGVFSLRPGPTQQPVGSSAGMPQAKQPTGWDKLLKIFLHT